MVFTAGGHTESPGDLQAGPRQRRHSLVFTAEAEKESQLRAAVNGVRNLPLSLLKARSEVRVASRDKVALSLCSRGLSPCDW